MVKKIFVSGIFVAASAMLYAPIFIIMIYSFTEQRCWATGPGFPPNSIHPCLLRVHIIH